MKLSKKTCVILYNADNGNPPEEKTENNCCSTLNLRTDVKDVQQALKELNIDTQTIKFHQLTSKITRLLEKTKPDFIFNLCETLYNHHHKALAEMYVAGWLELLKIPYTGAPPLALGLSLNKARCNQILRTADLPVPPCIIAPINKKYNLSLITPPFIIKPIREDGSFGITAKSVVKTDTEAKRQIKFVHQTYQQPALVEEFIEGRELTVALIDNPPRVLSIGEIDFSALPPDKPKIISYQAKWNNKKEPITMRYPAKLEINLKNKIEEISIKAFRLLGCRDYARIDVRLDKNYQPYILEVNPNPDISAETDFKEAAELYGLTYTKFIKIIVENTLYHRLHIDFQ